MNTVAMRPTLIHTETEKQFLPLRLTPALIGAALLVLGGCERPFVEERQPVLEVVTPNLDRVLNTSQVEFRIEVDAFREIENVYLNSTPLSFDEQQNVWQGIVELDKGLNTLSMRAVDDSGHEGLDTSYAFVSNSHFTTADAPSLLEPRGGHAAVVLGNGSLLVTGGSVSTSHQATAQAAIMVAGDSFFRSFGPQMNRGRMGHTATLLGDGRVLIAGGSTGNPTPQLHGLVEVVEIYNPVNGRFTTVPVVGQAVLRVHHAAFSFEAETTEGSVQYFVIHGGFGEGRSGSQSVGLRDDMQAYIFENDTLFYQNSIGIGSPGPLSGHSAVQLMTASGELQNQFLLTGCNFVSAASFELRSYLVHAHSSGDVEVSNANHLREERRLYAAAPYPGGAILHGGRKYQPHNMISSAELYMQAAKKFFHIPLATSIPAVRNEHSATYFDDGRILILGGFDAQGEAMTSGEWLIIENDIEQK